MCHCVILFTRELLASGFSRRPLLFTDRYKELPQLVPAGSVTAPTEPSVTKRGFFCWSDIFSSWWTNYLTPSRGILQFYVHGHRMKMLKSKGCFLSVTAANNLVLGSQKKNCSWITDGRISTASLCPQPLTFIHWQEQLTPPRLYLQLESVTDLQPRPRFLREELSVLVDFFTSLYSPCYWQVFRLINRPFTTLPSVNTHQRLCQISVC